MSLLACSAVVSAQSAVPQAIRIGHPMMIGLWLIQTLHFRLDPTIASLQGWQYMHPPA